MIDVPYPSIYDDPTQQSLKNFSTIQVGNGNKTIRMDERGFWLGSEDFESAPFRVAMDGALTIQGAGGFGDLAFEDTVNLDSQVTDGSTYKRTTTNEKTGAGRGYNAINASNRYAQWLDASEMTSGTTPNTGVVFDSSGIRGYKSGSKNFEITSGGDAYFRGDISASNINGSTINAYVNQTDQVSSHVTSSSYGFYVDQFGTNKLASLTAFDDGGGYLGVLELYSEGSVRGRLQASPSSGFMLNSDFMVWNGGDMYVGQYSGDTGSTLFCNGKLKIPVGTNLY